MRKSTYIRLFHTLTKGIFTWITADAAVLCAKATAGTDSIFTPSLYDAPDYIAAAVILYLLFAIAATHVLSRT